MSAVETMKGLKFELGQIVATPGAIELANDIRQEQQIESVPVFSVMLFRHSRGDWGEVCDEDKRANDAALLSGDRLATGC